MTSATIRVSSRGGQTSWLVGHNGLGRVPESKAELFSQETSPSLCTHLARKHYLTFAREWVKKQSLPWTLGFWLLPPHLFSSVDALCFSARQAWSKWVGSSAEQDDWQVSVWSAGVSLGQSRGTGLSSTAERKGVSSKIWQRRGGRSSSRWISVLVSDLIGGKLIKIHHGIKYRKHDAFMCM